MTREEREKTIEILKELKQPTKPFIKVGDDEKAIDMAIEALKQEPCEDAISRESVIDYLTKNISITDDEGYELEGAELRESWGEHLRGLPSVQPKGEPRRKGKWFYSDGMYCCDLCHSAFYEMSAFCPNCGSYKGDGGL